MKNVITAIILITLLLLAGGGVYHFYNKFNSEADKSIEYREEIDLKKDSISFLRERVNYYDSLYSDNNYRLKKIKDSLTDVIWFHKNKLKDIPEYYKEISTEKQIKHLERNLDTILYVQDENVLLPTNRAVWINTTYAEKHTLKIITITQQSVINTLDSINVSDSLYIDYLFSMNDSLFGQLNSVTSLSEKINKTLEKEEKKNSRIKKVAYFLGVALFVETLILLYALF